jgi:hypothetical protein
MLNKILNLRSKLRYSATRRFFSQKKPNGMNDKNNQDQSNQKYDKFKKKPISKEI